jgi:hypothetical protein
VRAKFAFERYADDLVIHTAQIQEINATFIKEKKIEFFKTKEEESSSSLCPDG